MQEFMKTAIKKNFGTPTSAGNLAMGLLQFAGTIPDHPGNTERFVICLMAGADMDDNLGLYDIVMLMIRRWAGKQNLDGYDACVVEGSRKICDVMGWKPLEV